MAEPDILDVIARKEQELRARLLAVRSRADAEIADARSRAARLRLESEEAARAETDAWRRTEIERIQQTAQAWAADHLASNAGPVEAAGAVEAAVQSVLAVVLPRPAPAAPETPLGRYR